METKQIAATTPKSKGERPTNRRRGRRRAKSHVMFKGRQVAANCVQFAEEFWDEA